MRKRILFYFGLVVVALTGLGLVVLFSASQANAIRLYGNAFHFFLRQCLYAGVGIVAAIACALFDYRQWRRKELVIALVTIVFALLLVVFTFPKINGSFRWINLGPIRIQPSELAKLTVVIALAAMLDKAGSRIEQFKIGALYPALVMGLLAGPVFFEPDYGSVLVIGLVGLVIMIVAGTRWKYIGLFALIGGLLFCGAVAMNGNRMARIKAFIGGSRNNGTTVVADKAAKRAAYQVDQALIAMKNGGIRGAGLGESLQKHYYLPEAHTDFIFAVGAEEMGLTFTLGVLIAFLTFLLYALHIARHAADRFGRLLVIGMTFIIFFQAMFNLGVVCKALPTKGMALPFFSYGGTNLVSAFIAVGTILSVGIHTYRDNKHALSAKLFV